MNRTVFLVALGGMLGCVARFLTASAVVSVFPSIFPIGTLIVNIVGCFIMGMTIGLVEGRLWIHHDWRAFLTAGFCGGFTTFSAFAFENVELLLNKSYGTFASYSVASFILCLLAVFGGLVLTRN